MTKIQLNSLQLRFHILGAATLFLLFASGCKRNEVGGLEIQPSSQLLGVVVTDTFTIIPYTELEDSLQTDEAPLQLLGGYNDPVFGYTAASIVSHVRLSSDNVDFGAGAQVVDSIVLSLQFDATYGNLDPQGFDIYEVTEDFYLDSTYYSNQVLTTDPTPIGQVTLVKPNPTDSVTTNDGTVPAQLRLRLSDSFGQRLLDADPSVYTSNDAWTEYFKGLRIVPNSPNAGTGEGGIWYFSLFARNSKMVLHFHDQGSTEAKSFDFVINLQAARFNQFEHDYTGSEVAPYLSNPGVPHDRLFVQSMAGTRVKIDMPFLAHLEDSGKIGIIKAELFGNAESLNTEYLAHGNMVLRTTDSDGDLALVPDFREGSSHFDGIYDNNTYSMTITRYVQQILNSNLTETSVYLNGGSAFNNGNRTPLVGIAGGADDLKVKISYTRL